MYIRTIVLFLLSVILVQGATATTCSQLSNTINSDVTLNVPSEYATIDEALDCLQFKTIGRNAIVTIQVANGNYVNQDTIDINHPNGARLHLIGNTTTEASCSFTFRNGQDGIVVSDGHTLGLIDGFKLIGDNEQGSGIHATRNSTLITGEHVTITSFQNGIYASWSSTIDSPSLVVDDNVIGVRGFAGSTISADSCTATDNQYGFSSSGGAAYILANSSTITGNDYGVYAGYNCSVVTRSSTIQNNTNGVHVGTDSLIDVLNSTVSSNTTNYNATPNTPTSTNSLISN